jgi:hypothetical protein
MIAAPAAPAILVCQGDGFAASPFKTACWMQFGNRASPFKFRVPVNETEIDVVS